MLRAVGVQLDNSTRPPEAIAARLVRKLRREDPQPQVERALELLRLLAETRGPLDDALSRLEQLFAAEAIDVRPIAELRAIGELLETRLPAGARMIVDGGLGRGLHCYRTNLRDLTARRHAAVRRRALRRSDPALGGRSPFRRPASPTAWSGYAPRRLREAPPARSVLVMAEQPGDTPAMLEVAEQLRERGWLPSAMSAAAACKAISRTRSAVVRQR